MKRIIKKVAVLGSGVMGSRIACHFANIGVQVLLLDIVPKELTPDEEKKGLTLESKAVRNRIVNSSLQAALASNPSPIYRKSDARLIQTGNFEDNMKDIATADWTIEVVVENLKIKKIVYDQVEQHRKPGTLITSNTSGIPIHMMLDGRSEDFRKHFCGTHFFNPPRYLKLLEIIPTPETDPAIVDFLMHYGDLYLGKTTVLAKDTPAFIANRVGIYAIMQGLQVMNKLGLNVDEVDRISGPIIGRPKSATFRTLDVVGLDTLANVANGLYQTGERDESRELFQLPGYLQKMVENKWLGDKTGQGFYKKTKDAKGKTEILTLDLNTLEYGPKQRAKFQSLEVLKPIEDLKKRVKVFSGQSDKAAQFFNESLYGLFQYVSNRIPEISDELYRIDDAMRAGFGWELGPFEYWDAIVAREGVQRMIENGYQPAAWVEEMLNSGKESFYIVENGTRRYYDINSKEYKAIPGAENFIILENLRGNKVVWKNTGATITDLGDGILNVEFHTKMNTMGGDVIMALNKGIDLAEKDFRGMVVGNQGANFSAGANVGLIYMYALDQDFDELNMIIRQFQNTMMRMRYSAIPVVGAPHGLTLGGGCELNLHVDHIQAAAETYMGLVEFGVGLIPGGGGTKEMTLRAADMYADGDIEYNDLKNVFLNIGMAKVSTSAKEAVDLGFMRKSDGITINSNRLIADAKAQAILLADAGYVKPVQRTNIKVQGKGALGMFLTGANAMMTGRYMSEHDLKISQKLAYVMCGGDLSAPTEVSEQYLLDLEREAFLSLTGERKTLERIQSILTTGKPLRN
ncbi:3-hydroxyacyl-CoA dehydrogenase/enoyl-CoA hydratase family protein [Pontibacter sp. BT310]|uniref:Enoyl-CoA hydratase/isomerase family protein n=1 Tax=Pontibacter populi TaxID=890055 RepID=A0ABS6XFF9_9BACT|nr:MULTISPECIES: 3-hydroxyacyl-CoA dehydrogenase/enoyl-CoA hydratase family protein [Pontibacter]MBJ6119868.1 3-hydroxyacyl-CoA dehydrogenase/enoyl-CoA hydratase family protein [Pontibacter sp. BT310]MBR0572297.1 3-hydroxyacyl-CoA dehydrogenase/enoyl-CoA hydratase family protein [Microvirga sp. STS03]MBW3366721.1 enoyl-CoA hydratase/isomerase family protein [Pontibacter populi]